MNFLITLLCFVLILGITVFIHELGHFIFAKRAKIYVYEFSIGMGPKLFKFNRKNDETDYCIRAFPIGGFVSMAGEQVEEDEKIPEDRRLQSKTWGARFMTVAAGVMMNFIMAILILFLLALFNGAPETKPYVSNVEVNYPAYIAGLRDDDLILEINGKKINNWDKALIQLELVSKETIQLKVKNANGEIKDLSITPIKEMKDEKEVYRYGFGQTTKVNRGLGEAIKYGFVKTGSLIQQMGIIIGNLFTGNLSVNSLAGPVGIFDVVGEQAKAGFENVIYLLAFISINVGFINLLPIPAFDGGRLLFLIIEKIKGKPVDPKVENIIHNIGFVLLMILMLYITFNDIMRLR